MQPGSINDLDQKEMSRRLIKLVDSPNARFWQADPDALSPPERIFRAIWELEAQVNNGGFRQFFWNTSGALVPYVVDALRTIDALTIADLTKRAIDLVGNGCPCHHDGERRAWIDGLSAETIGELSALDRSFFAYPDNLAALLYRYVFDHRNEIEGAAVALRPTG